MNDAVSRYIRIRDALAIGNTLDPVDAAFQHAVMVAVAEGRDWREAWGLPLRYRQHIAAADAVRALRCLPGGLTEQRRAIAQYEAGEFRSHQRRGVVPPGDRGICHQFLTAYGSTPSLRSFQRLLKNDTKCR
ncbi:hypothetical protein E3H11_31160 [Bradyrhizobium brasilense]|uniref:hypothetical protein n=1 Tax=Bradyrhizobium brasilense TaxID=1419277 RepID=UPI0014568C1A|nr:hypothetical protein [Bradyrhizobium brasilense]NLS73288.1 hypothetical protein [Bradyrhizobium brasilense]